MALLDEVRAANDAYAAEFTKGDLPMPPGRKVRGRRLHGRPARPGQGAWSGRRRRPRHPQRGRPRGRCLRSLVISQRLLGTQEVLVVHHTDCGMLTFDNPTLYGICQEQLGADASDIDFLPFATSSRASVTTSSSSAPRRSSRKTRR